MDPLQNREGPDDHGIQPRRFKSLQIGTPSELSVFIERFFRFLAQCNIASGIHLFLLMGLSSLSRCIAVCNARQLVSGKPALCRAEIPPPIWASRNYDSKVLTSLSVGGTNLNDISILRYCGILVALTVSWRVVHYILLRRSMS